MKITETGIYEFTENTHVYFDSMWYNNIKAKKGTKFRVKKIIDNVLYCIEAFDNYTFKIPTYVDYKVKKD